MDNKKTSFVMYPADFLAAVHNFRKNEVADLIIAICEFNLYGSTSVKLSGLKKDRFDSIQHVITLHNERWLQMCEINAQNAKKGASNRKANAKRPVSETSSTSPSGRPVESEKEKESEIENESGNDLENGCRERERENVDNSEFVGAPSAENVTDYCKELGIAVDVPAFMRWHNERGWRHGKKYVALDWKQAVRKWYCKDAGVSLTDFDARIAARQNELGKGKAVQND
ncbi:MAG: hypothetical protein IJ532_00665 [Alphaproteobacteria bacterium]|nr:hypothetical protein [Alphaproteobacteria bacterium]